MSVAVTLCAQPEHERPENENNHSFFRRSEKESLSGLLEFGKPAFFQFLGLILLLRWGEASKTRRASDRALPIYRPSGVETSVPGGGVNSNVDGGIGARDWFE